MVRLIEDINIRAIADAIRAKIGGTKTYKTSEMASAILGIQAGGDATADYLVSNRGGLTSYTFPSGITKIEQYAFTGCSKLALKELPETVTSIGQNAFASCTALAISKLPEGLTEVATSAFSMCKGITTMTLPAAITYVWTSAFSFCTNLTSVTFKGTPEEIAENAFNYCSKLTAINVPWGEGAVAGAPWGASNATINYNYTG